MKNGEISLIPVEINASRLYELQNGDIFTYNGTSLEYEDKLFYKVKEDGVDEFFNIKWVRTGEVFTAEEISKL